jgi:uncharacterized repeat protein (TIGR01451 family)
VRRAGIIALLAALLVAFVAPAAARADNTPWLVGAAKVDTTPAPFNPVTDLQDFPEDVTCLRSTYNGPRQWRFEEPYRDTDGSGDFNYPISSEQGGVPAPEPFCDYNHNGRWEGIYLSGGVDHRALTVHDPIDARAVAFTGNNGQTVVLVSVVAQGIFENYLGEARAMAESLAGQGSHATTCGHIDEMVISSNHNESSPDSVGIYGAPPAPSGLFGLNSSIDEYFMDWQDEQIANAAVAACDNRRPASLRAVEFPVDYSRFEQEIPGRFVTTADGRDQWAAIDNKVRVLQARDTTGEPIFTTMNLADHNQEIGHSSNDAVNRAISSDWPGAFHQRLEQDVGGMAMFLAGDVGSMEDLTTKPRISTTVHPECNTGCFAQSDLTGTNIADEVAANLASAEPVPVGAVQGRRTEFCAPLENNLFKAAAQGGIFGERQTYTSAGPACVPSGRSGQEVKTSVAVLDIGPDLQFLANPGEAFPGTISGGPWGIEDASCSTAPNPPVPSWHASAKHRFRIGLADDLIGYEQPAWSYQYGSDLDAGDPEGAAPLYDPTPTCNGDPFNHSHSLESEALGPTGSNLAAQNLAALLDANPDPAAEIRLGRYIKANGELTDAQPASLDPGVPGHFPVPAGTLPGVDTPKDAVAIWIAAPGETTLNATPGQPDSGTIVTLDDIGSFGGRPVDANGVFMDFDGVEEPNGPDFNTRGMLVKVDNGSGAVQKRYYVDVYPALTVSGSLGPSSPPAADLAVTQSYSPDTVAVGGVLTYTLDVQNNGPQNAHSVSLTDLLPKSVRLRSARSDHGRCAQRRPRQVVCNLANLDSGESASVTIKVRTTRAGSITNTATVRAASPVDPVLVNNAATATTTVNP